MPAVLAPPMRLDIIGACYASAMSFLADCYIHEPIGQLQHTPCGPGPGAREPWGASALALGLGLPAICGRRHVGAQVYGGGARSWLAAGSQLASSAARCALRGSPPSSQWLRERRAAPRSPLPAPRSPVQPRCPGPACCLLPLLCAPRRSEEGEGGAPRTLLDLKAGWHLLPSASALNTEHLPLISGV
jgi:hypothetical protein